jgi:ABC-type Fe3+-siderophore transport system permease subunit
VSRPATPVGPAALVVALGAAGLFAVADVLHGAAGLSTGVVLDALLHPDGSLQHEIVRGLRLPRAVAGLLAGAALAVAGVLFQAVTRNPLAEPATVGVNAGAMLAVTVVAAVASPLAGAPTILVAAAGGLVAAGLVWALATALGLTPLRLVLAGTAVSLTLAAVTATLQLVREVQASGLFLWGAGSLLQDGWSGVRVAAPVVLAALLAALALGRSLDVAVLGDDAAAALGQRAARFRALAGLLGVLLAAAAVSLVGPIAFVGFVAPHLVRLCGIRRHRPLTLVAAPLGGALLLAADVAAQRVARASELPAGVFTALIGVPLLVVAARRLGAAPEVGVGSSLSVNGRTARPGRVLAGLAAALGVACFLGLLLGDVELAAGALLHALVGVGDPLAEIVVELRAPRVVVAALAGACLAAAGVVLQGVVRNPLAGPEVVGVSSGAALAAVSALVLVPSLPPAALPVVAFLGGVGALALVLALAGARGAPPARLAVVGLAVTAAASAIVSLLLVLASARIAMVIEWLAGTTYGRGWGAAAQLAPAALVLLPLAWLHARKLDALAVGNEGALALGIRVPRVRAGLLALGAALASTTIAAVGGLSFVGLLAPHAARLLVGSLHRRLLPVAALLGALLVSVADTVGRAALAPTEIPAGLVVAFLGAPYLVLALLRARRLSG